MGPGDNRLCDAFVAELPGRPIPAIMMLGHDLSNDPSAVRQNVQPKMLPIDMGALSITDLAQLSIAGLTIPNVVIRGASAPTNTDNENPTVADRRLLNDTLADLESICGEAREDDLPEPDADAIANARSLLPKLFEILPVRYRVSPTERRGVAIDAPMRHGASVAVECAPDDTVYCFAAIDGNSRRAKFYQMDGLPDVFIEKALRDLGAG